MAGPLTVWPGPSQRGRAPHSMAGQVGVCKDQVLQEKLMCWPFVSHASELLSSGNTCGCPVFTGWG